MSNNIVCKISTVDELIDEIKNGRMIILVDDEDRENEGDLVCAAQFITPDTIFKKILFPNKKFASSFV
jgi:3,4-dihydroxy 2-butanone 4-phosphate synthase/GTP cyclohydrolase II